MGLSSLVLSVSLARCWWQPFIMCGAKVDFLLLSPEVDLDQLLSPESETRTGTVWLRHLSAKVSIDDVTAAVELHFQCGRPDTNLSTANDRILAVIDVVDGPKEGLRQLVALLCRVLIASGATFCGRWPYRECILIGDPNVSDQAMAQASAPSVLTHAVAFVCHGAERIETIRKGNAQVKLHRGNGFDPKTMSRIGYVAVETQSRWLPWRRREDDRLVCDIVAILEGCGLKCVQHMS